MNDKFKSRTFMIVVAWFVLALLGLIAQIIVRGLPIPLDTIFYFAGITSAAYVGIKQPVDAWKETRNKKPVDDQGV